MKIKLPNTPWLIILVYLVITSCIDQIDVTLGEEPVLIVDGIITDQFGPHQVKLGFSTGFNKNALFENTPEEVEGALVEIVDDAGIREALTDQGNGIYFSRGALKGEVGKSYHVEVHLSDGKTYRSLPECLMPTAQITNGAFEKTSVDILTSGATASEDRIVFKIDFQDNPQEVDYYRWRYQGTYQVFAPCGARPDSCIVACPNGGPCWQTVADCWATAFDFQFLKTGNDQLTNGKQVQNMEVYSTPLDRQFNIGYSSLIQQFALTERAYTYWEALENQINSTGSIFEAPSFQIQGNLRSVENPQEFVLGYFGASGVTSTRVFVDRSDVGEFFGDIPCEGCTPSAGNCIPAECVDCRQWPATGIKPYFWPN